MINSTWIMLTSPGPELLETQAALPLCLSFSSQKEALNALMPADQEMVLVAHTLEQGAQIAAHYHPKAHEWIILEEGAVQILMLGRSFALEAGANTQVLSIPSGIVHSLTAHRASTYLVLRDCSDRSVFTASPPAPSAQPEVTAAAPRFGDFPNVFNVCNQELKEICRAAGHMSVAHVTMEASAQSLLHRHSSFTECYLILEGCGVLVVGDQSFAVEKDSVVEIPPGKPHKLINGPLGILKHLVICAPAFNAADVILMEQAAP
jgi:mannose-6-phosphate isomerase-like protein (cupin superfamily)